ncbi:DUF6588 family protein [Fodinibius sediminis]|uniref:Outer membrane protein beta-barrel domain-containing protein n=1 Tax=Fodinibius sediminis TaxID=1214077 RepID=A0A521B6J8_9BACT|nr:DUF6588 family protein [Fodinibius sediminis]SMO42290.1 hypothetical protein SAMN06265218_102212 [Fodinibius sediminis]
MNKTIYAIISFGFLLIAGASPLRAQLDNAGTIIKASATEQGRQDANTLLKAYFKPIGKGFGTDLNTGWFNTAKTHSLLGFDLTVSASVARVPGSDRSFNVQKLNLKELEYIEEESTSPVTPTAFGPGESNTTMGAYYSYTNPQTGEQQRERVDFEMPAGTDVPYVPAPMVQASVGFIKGTDVTVRYVPPLDLPNDIKLDLWGVGLKHDITEWLPGGKLIPVNISLQAGYTKLNSSIAFNVDPEQGADVENNYDPSTWNGQKAALRTNAFTVNALVGKTLPFISLYGGIGYETSSLVIDTPGSYPVTVPNEDFPDQSSQPKKIKKVDNPIDISYDKNSSFRGLVGTRIKLAFFNVTASYTLSKYPVGQVGVGFSFR